MEQSVFATPSELHTPQCKVLYACKTLREDCTGRHTNSKGDETLMDVGNTIKLGGCHTTMYNGSQLMVGSPCAINVSDMDLSKGVDRKYNLVRTVRT